ncbi:hypothetical protein ACN27F_32835 [Solwaraspora sp. WMMB335]|uniref:hypothetical protein n=1 Tax=Solwaraspora sp. WMMB335 TaxID=3404118 RepID=UPI003B9529CD
MRLVTLRAVVKCGHDGIVGNVAAQRWVRISGQPVLVAPDPQGRAIAACPNYGATMKPCTTTLRVMRGYRDWIRVDGKPVVAADLDGLTDGTAPGTVHYTVRSPGQRFVGVDR